MAEPNQSNLTNPDLWIRLVYMVLFWLLSWLARMAMGVIAIIQFVITLINGEVHAKLRDIGWAIARWTEQTYQFLAFASDEKPFPFQEWPVREAAPSDVVAPEPAETPVAEPVVEVLPAADESSLSDSEPNDDQNRGGFGNIREP